MNAHDFCLIVDNDRELLRAWLAETNRRLGGGWTADAAYSFALTALERFGFLSRGMSASTTEGQCPTVLIREVARLALARVDWDEVAEHYRTKVQEGTTA